jgi:alpha-beta hydrolase superfamily lysophospholipase
MHRSEEIFQGQDGLKLYSQSWHPSGKTIAKLVIIHGVAEHSNRYLNLVNGLVEPGFALYAYDQRGHGNSEGQRGYIDSWAQYRTDLGIFLNRVKKHEPDLPLFIYGHSMGALVILDYLLQESNGLNGAIISGSPIDSSKAASPILILTARILSRVWPTFSMASPLQPDQLSCDARVVQAYVEDPDVFKTMTVRWGAEYLDAQERVKEHAADIKLPILIIHGGEDLICTPEGSEQLYATINSEDKTIKIYPSYFHEIHNEPGHIVVIEDIRNWMEAHLVTEQEND